MNYNTYKIEPRGLGADFYNHKIFNLFEDLDSFYSFLSDRASDFANGFILSGQISFISNIYNSIGGTIESIKVLSYIGRLNDVFALIRKLEDAILIDLYKSILLTKEELKFYESEIPIKDILDDSVIRTWTRDTYKLFKVGDLNKIKALIKQEDIQLGDFLHLEDDPFRTDCNNNVHYNSWNNFKLNIYEYLQIENQGVLSLNKVYSIVVRLFAIHFSYTYIQHPEFYSSSDYSDALENGEEPTEGSQYWVASIVQDVFDKYIKTEYSDVANYLISKQIMALE